MHPLGHDTISGVAGAEVNWRVVLDRAWRSDEMRRQFEGEKGFARMDQIGTEDIMSGLAEAYHHEFFPWAASKLGIENQLPDYMIDRFSKLRL